VLAAAVPTVGYGAALLVSGPVRHVEACLSAELVAAAGTDGARCVGDTTVYRLDGLLTGHSVTFGCTSLLLLGPFVAVTVLLSLVPRVPVPRIAVAAAVAVVGIPAVNQVRMLTVHGGMRLWGVERGYELTHILVGTTISVLGTAGIAAAFLTVLTAGDRAARRRRAGQAL
jgi:exosortase/archaeosortase family protein